VTLRTYKLGVLALLCVTGFLAWKCWHLSGEVVWADYIEKQCVITQDMLTHPPEGFGPRDLAERLRFLMGYYSAHQASVGSQVGWIVKRDYERTLTNAVALFRNLTTNDLGSDPEAWIQKYGR